MTLLLSGLSQANSFKVVFLNPGYPDVNATGSFWGNVSLFMNAAANDLDIELITLYGDRNHILMKSLVEQIISYEPKYIVLVNEKGIALSLLKEISKHKIPVFMLLNTFSDKEFAQLSRQEKIMLKGSVVPNNYSVGKKLINGLFDMYEALPNKVIKNAPRTLLALEGDYATPASLERKRGLNDVLLINNELVILDSTVANWSKNHAYQKVKGILRRSQIDIIWAANDAMAFGAKKAVVEANLAYPVMIGGINWDIDDLDYPVNLSFGGHVALGAIALIMLKDLDMNNLSLKERHQVIDIFESSLSASFSLFSKRLNDKKLNYYDFSRFCRSSENYLNFSIENLEETYERH